ncbi:unnamed protein product, partial [Symbiodinium pilosum]
KPADPLPFLSSQLLKSAVSNQLQVTNDVITQATAPAPQPNAGPPANAGPASVLPFKDYYAGHIRTMAPAAYEKIHAKFPAQPKPVAAAVPPAPPALPKTEQVASVPQIKSAPAPVAPAMPAAPAAKTPFAKLPSVGTWLAPSPAKLTNAQAKAQTSVPAAAPAPAPAPAAEAPVQPAAVTLTPFTPYYNDHVRTMAPAAYDKLYAKFPAKSKPEVAPPAPPAAAEKSEAVPVPEAKSVLATVSRTPFALLPSVATWLAASPLLLTNATARTPEAVVSQKQAPAVGTNTATPSAISLTPFTPYYATHLRTINPSSLSDLYSKFPCHKPEPLPVLEKTMTVLMTMEKDDLIHEFQ